MFNRKPSAAMIVAIVAVFVALSGGALAASHYVLTSTHQIKPGVLKQLKGKPGARGPAGATGAAGLVSAVTDVNSAAVSMCAFGGGDCDVGEATATCPAGMQAVGGAANVTTIETSISTYASTTSYIAVADNSSEFAGTLTAEAICAPVAGTHAAADTAGAAAQATTDLRRLRRESR